MATRRTRKSIIPVALVGAGPRDPGLLTVLAAEALRSADVVVADAEVAPAMLEGLSAEILKIGDTEAVAPLADADGATAAVVARARSGARVVRLYASDPWLTDIGVSDAQAFAKAKIPFRLIPGVPTGPAVAAYAGVAAGLPVTLASTAVTSLPGGSPFGDGTLSPLAPLGVSSFGSSSFGSPLGGGLSPLGGLGASLEPLPGDVDWAAIATAPGTLIVTTGPGEIGKLAAVLVEHGRTGDTPVSVTVEGTSTDQRTIVSTLDRVETDAAAFATLPAVVSVGEAVAARAKLSWWETRALFGWTVLVPRTKEQSAVMSELLRGHGASPLEVPTIAVEPPRTAAPMDRAITGLVSGRYQWVAFTSVNAVKAVREKLEERSLDARALADVKIAAIGEATADVLRSWGIRPDRLPTGQQSSEGLLEVWPEYDDVLDPIDRVLLPRADIATDTLVAGLKDRGWAVDDVTAYRTVRAAPPPAPIREALKGGRVDAVAFTSSSTVRNLVGIAGKPHETTVIAVIGPQTAATAAELGLRVDVQAPEATIPSLVGALAEFAQEKREELGKVGPLSARLPRSRRGRR